MADTIWNIMQIVYSNYRDHPVAGWPQSSAFKLSLSKYRNHLLHIYHSMEVWSDRKVVIRTVRVVSSRTTAQTTTLVLDLLLRDSRNTKFSPIYHPETPSPVIQTWLSVHLTKLPAILRDGSTRTTLHLYTGGIVLKLI